MKQHAGFAAVGVGIAVVVLIVIAGLAYVWGPRSAAPPDSQSNSISDTEGPQANPFATTTQPVSTASLTLSDAVIASALNSRSPQDRQLWSDVERTIKGDLNGDGYQDAYVRVSGCGACGTADYVAINQKDGAVTLFQTSIGAMSGGTGADYVESVSIDNGILTAAIITDGGSGTRITNRFRFVNDGLVKIN